ncbi:hypothetical protein PENSPDRAFT_125554 [Peniophora sp. CONT]|nr:hypothetical protein PENSPDRAFT_125554 [Peniophora sp. CONT]
MSTELANIVLGSTTYTKGIAFDTNDLAVNASKNSNSTYVRTTASSPSTCEDPSLTLHATQTQARRSTLASSLAKTRRASSSSDRLPLAVPPTWSAPSSRRHCRIGFPSSPLRRYAEQASGSQMDKATDRRSSITGSWNEPRAHSSRRWRPD